MNYRAVLPATWTRIPHNVHMLGFQNDRLREPPFPMLGSQTGDPTARAWPCTGATKLWDVDVSVFLKVVVEPSESSEELAFPALSASRRLWLGIAIGRDESHSYGFCCCDLFIGELARAILHPKTGNPESDSPCEPFFMRFGVRVAVFPGVCRQAYQTTVEVDSAPSHT